MTRCLRSVLLSLVVLGGPLAASAGAAGLATGFVDGPQLQNVPPVQQVASSLGARYLRINVTWANVAPERLVGSPTDPSNPGYRWSNVDQQVRSAVANGLTPVLMVFHAPTWAMPPDAPPATANGAYKPSATDLRAFAEAIASRYGGSTTDGAGGVLPRVRYYQAWNEPNLVAYLGPQWERAGSGIKPVGPAMYRDLLNAFYAGVKGVSRSNVVVAAGTAPFGQPNGQLNMRPVIFERYLLCLSGNLKRRTCRKRSNLDVFDHHPFSIRGPDRPAISKDDVSMVDLHKITDVWRAGERLGTVRPRGRRPFWATEWSWDTNPPDPDGISLNQQATWVARGLYQLWRNDFDVGMYLEVYDAPDGGDFARTIQAGLYFIDGTAKPSAQAFRFPLAVQREKGRKLTAWARPPVAGRVVLERASRGGWAQVATKRARADGAVTFTLPAGGKPVLRARIGSETSLSASP